MLFYRKLRARSDRSQPDHRAWKNPGEDSDIPATRTTGFLNVISQALVIVVHSVPMSRPIGMNVGQFMRFRIMMLNAATMVMLAVEPVVVSAARSNCCLGVGDKGRLQHQHKRCHHHDEGGGTFNSWLLGEAQPRASLRLHVGRHATQATSL